MLEEVRDCLENIQTSIRLIDQRFEAIDSPDDFLSEPDGLFALDAIAMRLQMIGENVKSLAKLSPDHLERFNDVEWQKIMRLRDLISHHYDALDHEIIFNICQIHIPALRLVVGKMLED